MQRVRIGLTGLAFVFLLALLGSVFTDASDEAPITANAIEQHRTADAVPDIVAKPKEPLAELGVAPGRADENEVGDPANESNDGAPDR